MSLFRQGFPGISVVSRMKWSPSIQSDQNIWDNLSVVHFNWSDKSDGNDAWHVTKLLSALTLAHVKSRDFPELAVKVVLIGSGFSAQRITSSGGVRVTVNGIGLEI